MAADGRIVIDVILDDGSVVQGLANIDGQFNDLDRNGSSRLAKIGGGIKNLAKVAAFSATAVVGIGAAIGGLAAPLVKAAGDAQAMNAQFETVFGNLEQSATTALNNIADETGIIPDRLKGSFTQIAAFAKTTGMETADALALTERATLAAADSAAFYDKSIEEVTESLQSFLKGNFENDAALGISATETTRNAKANELYGKSFIKLDEAQKQLTLMAMVEDGNKLSGALGQAARETDGLENVLGNLRQAWENLKVKLGEPILDPAIAALKWLTQIISNFDVAPFINAFNALKDVVTPIITTFVEEAKAVFSTLKDFWSTDGQSMIDNLRTTFESLREAIVPKVTEAFELVKNVVADVRTVWEQDGQAIVERLVSIFESLKSIAVPIVESAIDLIVTNFQKIKGFWDANGEQITQAVSNAFQGILTVVETVMPAVKFVIEYIWNAIKNVITGALDVIMGAVKVFSGLFTGDFSKMWEGVKQLFSGAIDLIMGLMSLSFVGGIRTLVTNLAKTFVNLIKTKWTTVVGLFKSSVNTVSSTISSWVGKLLGFIKNLATNFTSTVTTLRTTVVTRFKELSTQVINAVKGLPAKMLQIGKDVLQGLINGIKAKAGEAVKAITGVVDGIINSATSILGIASPSKVFKQIGLWTGEGLAIGLDNSSKTVNKAMENIGDGILAVSNEFQKEYDDLISEFNKKNENKEDAALKKIQNIRNAAAKKKKALTKAQLQEIATLEASYLDQKETSDIAFNKKYKAMVEKSEKEYLDVIKNYIADKKSLEELSLVDEAKIWEQSIELFTEGTKQRIELQKSYKSAVEAVNKELMEINDKYTSRIKKIDDDFIQQSADKTKEYVDEFKKREQSLVSFAGTFDEFAVSADVTGAQLLSNLKGQVKGFEDWKKEIEKLSSKAIDDGLLAELQDMGPKALAELRALNSLSEAQLAEYSSLYAEKAKQAREQAEKELAPLKNSTEQQIAELRKAANNELAKLEKDWIKEIKDITGGTENELKTLESIGEDAIRGLISGMNSMHPSLKSTADAIAETVSKTVKDTLKVKSPSRVMIQVGKDVGEGLAIGIEGSQVRVANASRLLANAIVSESTEVLADANKTFDEKLEYWFTPGENADEYVNKMTDIESKLTTIEKNGIRSREKIHQDAADRRAEIDQKYLSTFENIEQYKQQLVKGMLAVGKEVDINEGWIVEAALGLYAGPLELYKEELEKVKQFEDKALEEYEKLTDEKAKLQKELADARLSAEKNFIDKLKSLNELSVADELKLYETLMQGYAEGSEQRLHYEQKIIDTRKQALQAAVKDVDSFGDALMDALDKKYELQLDLELANSDSYYDSIINPLKEAEKMLDKQFADEDRANNMAGLQSALSSARTEADRKRIQQQIDEENKKWSRQQQKDTVRAEIEKVEAAKKEARDGITGKYEAMMSQEALEHEARKLIVAGNEQEMIDLLNSFNPKWQDAGQSFGDQLINGLNSMKKPLADAVQEMVEIISSAKVLSTLGFNGGSMAAAVTNELRNVKVDLGNVKPITGVFDAYAIEMARMQSVNVNTTIASAPVILDGREIGVIDFEVIDTEAGNRANAKMRYSGVKA